MRDLRTIRCACQALLMMSLVLLLFPVRVQAQVGVERQGYSIVGGNKVVIDSKEQWSFWKAAAKTIQVTDEGVRPGFMRKSTEIEIDGQMVRVPGIDVVPNAFEFGGGIKAAGSNASIAADLMDGHMDTYWEPDMDDPIENWWVQIDLGQLISVTKIVLRFVGEDLGDPFLQFKVLTAQGEPFPGRPDLFIFRKVLSTDQPNLDERVFEVDMTLLKPTDFPDVLGDFTGDVIRYLVVVITDSRYGKGLRVTESGYESLEPDERGEIEYFRRESTGRLRLVEGLEYWQAIEDESKRGPVVHYRRELPRLAEVEVWSVGDNIALGILDRGGTLESTEAPNEPNVVDGKINPAYNIANQYKNDPAREDVQIERELRMDLGGAFFLDNVRMITDLGGVFGQGTLDDNYAMRLSDGSRTPDGSLAWKFVAEVSSSVREEFAEIKYHDHKFEASKAKFFSLTWTLLPVPGGGGRGAIKEIQLFGEGYLPEAQIVSIFDASLHAIKFEGSIPFIELPGIKNLTSIEWDADTPEGTDVLIQTKTGDTVEQVIHYFKMIGDNPRAKELHAGNEKNAFAAYAKLFSFNKGDIVTETVPGTDWSGWSETYVRSGDRFRSPSPRKYVMIRATFLTDDPFRFATLRSVRLNFLAGDPVATSVIGEVTPSRLDSIGIKQELSFFIRPTFDFRSKGLDEILIEAPSGVRMNFKQVNKWEDQSIEDMIIDGDLREPDESYTDESEGFEVLSRPESDSLWVRLPGRIKTTTGNVLLEVKFEVQLFGFSTFFDGSIGNSSVEGSWQRTDDGDANGVTDSEKTVVLALEGNKILDDIEVDPKIITPNGDGINDKTSISFLLLRVGLSTPVQVQIYDLSGNIVVELLNDSLSSGAYKEDDAVIWDGTDRSGGLVTPGIYVIRINVDTDSDSAEDTSVSRLVQVAY